MYLFLVLCLADAKSQFEAGQYRYYRQAWGIFGIGEGHWCKAPGSDNKEDQTAQCKASCDRKS